MVPEATIWEKFPILNTHRLTLRQIRPKDIHQIFEGLSDQQVIKYYAVSFNSLEATEEQMKWYEGLWKNRTGIWWAISLKGEKELIGACGFNNYEEKHRKVEIGYWLFPAFWQKGFASEAIKKILEFGFEQMQLQRMEAFVEEGNDSSSGMLEKLNFSYEGTMRHCEFKNGTFINVLIYALLQNDYRSGH